MKPEQDPSPQPSRIENTTLEIQEVLKELAQTQKTPPPLNNATDLLNWELQVQSMTDRLRGLIVAQGIQWQLDTPDFKAQSRQVAQSGVKKKCATRAFDP